jgi:plectin
MEARSVSSGGPAKTAVKEKQFLDQLKEIQQMEKQTKETLEKFMSTLSQRTTSEDCASLLLEKMEELKKAESVIEAKTNDIRLLNGNIQILNEKHEQIIMQTKKTQEENTSFQALLADSDKVIRKLEAQIMLNTKNYQLEVEQKTTSIKLLEDECSNIKASYSELQTRLESNNIETSELHGAMAGLHGEISVLQSELDDAKEREKEIIRQRKEILQRLEIKEEIIIKHQSEKQFLQNKVIDLERKIADIGDKTALIQHESNFKVDTLVRERDNVQGSLAKMNLKIKQQAQTLQELNSLLTKMKNDLNITIEAKNDVQKKLEISDKKVVEVSDKLQVIEATNAENERLYAESQQEIRKITLELSQVKDKNVALVAEGRKSATRIERLERDKYDMAVDLSNKSKDLESIKSNFDNITLKYNELQEKVELERAQKDRVIDSNSVLETELERLRVDNREHQENLDSLSRQLRESDRMREQALEVSRQQQRENANRIVEFSQKNAKLASELSSLRDEISTLKRHKEELMHELNESNREKSEVKSTYVATRSRLQALEDQYEETNARLEGRKAELDEIRSDLRREIANKDAMLHAVHIEHEKQIQLLTKQFEDETEEKVNAMIKLKQQSDSNYEKTIAKAKELHNNQIEELQNLRQRDASEAKQKVSTIAKTMESLQVELREETNKNKALLQELTVMKDLIEVGSTESQERLHYVERERLRDRARLEGQLTDIKEQLRQHSEQKQQRDQLMTTIEQQLSREREARFSAMQKIRTLEDELNSVNGQLEALKEENLAVKKQNRDHERKLALAIQSKDAELLRLTRRNEVLGEAVTRLTTQNGSGSNTNVIGSLFASTSYADTTINDAVYNDCDVHGDEDTSNLTDAIGDSSSTLLSERPRSSVDTTSKNSSNEISSDNVPDEIPNRAKSAPPFRRSLENRLSSTSQHDSNEAHPSIVHGMAFMDNADNGVEIDGTIPINLFEGAVHSNNITHKSRGSLISDGDENSTALRFDDTDSSDGMQPSSGEKSSVFIQRVRDSVEKSKDNLLPYSPTPKYNNTPGSNRSNDSHSPLSKGIIDLLSENESFTPNSRHAKSSSNTPPNSKESKKK